MSPFAADEYMVTNAEISRSGLPRGPVGSATTRARSSGTRATSRSGGTSGGSLGWHGPALLLLLVAIFPLVAVESVWSADIGARLYQAKTLIDTGDWVAIHPLPRADPEGLYFPLHLSAATEAAFRYIPYPKHPLLVWLTVAEYQLAVRLPGDTDTNIVSTIVGLHTLSAFATAVGTARLVARSRPSLAIPALWFTGLISPLFVTGYTGHAHTLAAACFVWSAVCLLEFTEPLPPRKTSDVSRLVVAGVLIGLACLVRTESTLLGIAMTAALALAGRQRPSRNRWTVAAIVVAMTTGASTVADRFALPATAGPANPSHGGDPWGGLIGRVEGIQRTMLSPGGSTSDLLILAVAVLVVLAGYIVGRGRANLLPEVLLAGGTIAAMMRVRQGDMVLIFGIVLACPLLIIGLLRVGRLAWNTAEHRFYLITTVLFTAAVAATQYRYGGGAEWGGRYLAIGVPFAVVLSIRGFDVALKDVPVGRVRRLVVLAVLPAIALNFAGLHGIRESRIRSAALVDTVAETAATLQLRSATANDESAMEDLRTDGQDDPIVITTVPAAGRLSWSELDNGRWLLVDKGELGTVAARLSSLGVRHWVLLSTDIDEELDQIENHYRPEPWHSNDQVPADVVIVTAAGG